MPEPVREKETNLPEVSFQIGNPPPDICVDLMKNTRNASVKGVGVETEVPGFDFIHRLTHRNPLDMERKT